MAADTATDRRRLRFMALGFGVGSVLFALGTVWLWLALPQLGNVTYALGALGFTSAAFVQWRAAMAHRPRHGRTGWRQLHSDLTDPDWSSAAIQFVGTVEFNVMTLRAVAFGATPDPGQYAQVWQPDVVGSALFLISSWIAWHPMSRRRRHALISQRSAWICWSNLAGSVLFAVSAWGAALLPDGGLRSELWTNLGTFGGAIGFLLASVLLWPGRSGDAA